MKVIASLFTVAVATCALTGCTAPVGDANGSMSESTSSSSEALTAPTIEVTQGPGSWQFEVTGSGFTPGGQVWVYVTGQGFGEGTG